jgi:hypothetical protein
MAFGKNLRTRTVAPVATEVTPEVQEQVQSTPASPASQSIPATQSSSPTTQSAQVESFDDSDWDAPEEGVAVMTESAPQTASTRRAPGRTEDKKALTGVPMDFAVNYFVAIRPKSAGAPVILNVASNTEFGIEGTQYAPSFYGRIEIWANVHPEAWEMLQQEGNERGTCHGKAILTNKQRYNSIARDWQLNLRSDKFANGDVETFIVFNEIEAVQAPMLKDFTKKQQESSQANQAQQQASQQPQAQPAQQSQQVIIQQTATSAETLELVALKQKLESIKAVLGHSQDPLALAALSIINA